MDDRLLPQRLRRGLASRPGSRRDGLECLLEIHSLHLAPIDSLEHAVEPLVARHPAWGARILRGTAWRALVNRRCFDAVERQFDLTPLAA